MLPPPTLLHPLYIAGSLYITAPLGPHESTVLFFHLALLIIVGSKLAGMALTKEVATREEEFHGILIVGGGICGLATALALHRYDISLSSPFMRCF
jgi:hypothetical protein